MSKPQLEALKQQEEQRRLSKEELLRPQIRYQDEYIESLGGVVKLKSMSYADRQRLRQETNFGSADFNEEKFELLGLALSIVEPKLEESDLEELKQQDQAVIDELVVKVSLLNMIGRAEHLKKESKETPS